MDRVGCVPTTSSGVVSYGVHIFFNGVHVGRKMLF